MAQPMVELWGKVRPLGDRIQFRLEDMMRSAKLIVGAAVISALAGISAASAADLAPMYTKAPPPVAIIYDWTGFYIGGNSGYSWGRARTDGSLAGTQNVSVFRTAGPTLVSSVTTA